jgi:hypothetical protein
MLKTFVLLLLSIQVIHADVGYSSYTRVGPYKAVVGRNLQTYDDGYIVYNIDGSTDDYKVIQKAVNAAILKGGGEVFIKGGIYILNHSITVGNKVHFRGDGMDVTTLKLADHAEAFVDEDSGRSGFIRVQAPYSVTISDLTLDGNKCNQYNDDAHQYGKHGIYMEGVTNLWVDNVKAINWQGYGFDFHIFTAGSKWGKRLTVSNCIVNNNNQDGLIATNTLNVFVVNTTANNNGGHGLSVKLGPTNATFINNTAMNNGYGTFYMKGGCGIMLQNNRDVSTSVAQIFKNQVSNNFRAGICTNDAQYVHIRDNSVNNCECYQMSQTYSSFIENNKCTGELQFDINSDSKLNSSGTFTSYDQLTGNNLNIFEQNNQFTLDICQFNNQTNDCPNVQPTPPIDSSTGSNQQTSTGSNPNPDPAGTAASVTEVTNNEASTMSVSTKLAISLPVCGFLLVVAIVVGVIAYKKRWCCKKVVDQPRV